MARLKVAILISGRGSNLEALVASCAAPGFPAEIGLVISNRVDAAGLDKARHAGIPTKVIPHGGFKRRDEFDAALSAALVAAGIDLVCLAGFMRLLGENFVSYWHDRVINIHPSLLPAFPGLHSHERAIEQGVRIAGCTVHFVRSAMDNGPIIVQAAVPVLSGDDAETLAARVLAAEHRAYPLALRLIAEGNVKVVGERAEILDVGKPGGMLLNPAD